MAHGGDSLQTMSLDELTAMAHHPTSSRVLDAVLESPTVPFKAKRKFVMAFIGHYHVLVDDRMLEVSLAVPHDTGSNRHRGTHDEPGGALRLVQITPERRIPHQRRRTVWRSRQEARGQADIGFGGPVTGPRI